MINIIAAVAENNCIGLNGNIPWNEPADKDIFKKLTMSNVVIMGRKTYESIGRPLPGRINIVVSGTMKSTPGIFVEESLEKAIEKGKSFNKREIFLCGGESIYSEGIAFADTLYISRIKGIYEGDTFFPEIDTNKFSIAEQRKINENFTFFVYKRA